MHGNVTIVVYHHISHETHPLTSEIDITIHPDLFLKHIRYFAKNYDLIGINDLLADNLPRKPLLITFDDAYRSVLEVAAPILRAVNAPSIFFLNTAPIVSPSVPFDNVLSYAVVALGIERVLSCLKVRAKDLLSTSQLIAKIGTTLKFSEISAGKCRIFSTLGTTEAGIYNSSKLFLESSDVTALAKYRIAVGNHSMTHVFFRDLTTAELDREISESRTMLERISGQSVNCLSIPYGSELDATKAVLSTARASGHEAIFLVHARSNRFRPAKDIYYRICPGNVRTATLSRQMRVDPILRTIRDTIRSRQIWNVWHY
jgi:peptidoglycan/xylan/chitin deacetylase (PgdA/CDA1 family)